MLELITGPINGGEGHRVETFWIEKRCLVVIPQNRHLAPLDDLVEAFARVGAVTNNIAQAKDLGDPLGTNVVEHHAKRFVIGVDIADERPLHGDGLSYKNSPCTLARSADGKGIA